MLQVIAAVLPWLSRCNDNDNDGGGSGGSDSDDEYTNLSSLNHAFSIHILLTFHLLLLLSLYPSCNHHRSGRHSPSWYWIC